MGQGRFGHDRILSGVIVCHVVGNNGVFPERGSRGPCVGFWVPGSIWQRMWYFCAKFLWIKGVFYHGLCVIIYAGRIVPCLHWYLIRVIGRMTSLEWFSIWETSNNIINFNDVRKRLWKLVSMMMFSPCVFCVLPCVTSAFTVSKLARIIKQASRVGGCERVFTPVRWRQVRLSCIKWRSTFFLYFFRASIVRSAVRHQGGRLLRQLCCWVGVSAQRTHHAKTTSLWRYHHGKPRSRSRERSKFKVIKWVRLPIDSHPFQTVPCQSATPLQGYSFFKIGPWKSKNSFAKNWTKRSKTHTI